MTETKSLVPEHLHALQEVLDDIRADLQETHMCVRAMGEGISGLQSSVSTLVAASSARDGKIEHLNDRLDRIERHLDLIESQR